MMQLEQDALKIISMLNSRGYAAYFVGGYVRDRMAGRPVKDIDIATSATPEEIMALFPRTVPTGLQHGTVTVLEGGHAFEVTTFRTESDYADFRRPLRVEFVDRLDDDLRRRDFTMNAMALDADGRLIDPHGGMADLREGRLRCVGDPQERFREDALRLMRCIRFAAEYQLTIEPETWTALVAQRALLGHIAIERIRSELERIVEGSAPDYGFELLNRSGLMDYVPAELTLTGQACECLAEYGKKQRFTRLVPPKLRWPLLAFALGKSSEEAARIMRQLTFPKGSVRNVHSVLAMHEWMIGCSSGNSVETLRSRWVRAVLKHGKSTALQWLVLLKVMAEGDSSLQAIKLDPDVADVFAHQGVEWLHAMPVHALADLAVSGSDIVPVGQARGWKRGPWIGEVMSWLLEETASGKLANERAPLMAAARRWIERESEGKEDRT